MSDTLREIFFEKNKHVINQINILKREHSTVVIGSVTVGQVLTGQKGIPALLTDTSKLDPHEGIRYRGYTITALQEILPKLKSDGEPLTEGLFYLFMTGSIPTMNEAQAISKIWKEKEALPDYAIKLMDNLPSTLAPMTQLSTVVTALAGTSSFQKAYVKGIAKSQLWEYAYEDVMTLIARLPLILAYIYRKDYHKGEQIKSNPKLDWAGNLAHMMGYEKDEVKKLMRFFMFLHADHEGGNVSAHTTHLVGSALSNPYLAFAAGLNGLAGPLHGRANQEVLDWIFNLQKELKTNTPTEKQLKEYVKQTLNSGRVIPGYGHAVLRITDPRYVAQLHFAEKYIKGDPMVDIVKKLYEIVPPILQETGKVSNPWPNIDAISGSILNHYGIGPHSLYTALFGVSRSIGVLSSLVLDRLYGLPLERPTSFPTNWFLQKTGEMR